MRDFEVLVYGASIPVTRCSIEASDLETFKQALEIELGLSKTGGIPALELFDPDFAEWAVCSSFKAIPPKVKVRITADPRYTGPATRATFSEQFQLLYVPNGSLDHTMCKDMLEEAFGKGVQLDCVERVENPKLDQNFRLRRSELRDSSCPTVKRLLNGDTAFIGQVSSEGFRLPNEPGVCGLGLYFASNVTLTEQFKTGTHKLLLCEVAVGRQLQENSPDSRLDLAKLEVAGFDSVLAPKVKRSSGGTVEFIVVYNPDQAVPRFVLTFSTRALNGEMVENPCNAVGHSYGMKEVEAFCESCSQPVCLACIHLGGHKAHEVVKLAEGHQKHLEHVHDLIRSTRHAVIKMESVLKSYQNSREVVEQRRDELLGETRKRGLALVEAIQNRQRVLIDRITRTASELIEEHCKAEQSATSYINETKAGVAAAEEASRWSSVQFLSSTAQFEKILTIDPLRVIELTADESELMLRMETTDTDSLIEEGLERWECVDDRGNSVPSLHSPHAANLAPTITSVVPDGPTSLAINWDKPREETGTTSFVLEMASFVANSGDPPLFVEVYHGPKTQWHARGLPLASQRLFRVKAVNLSGKATPWSAEILGKTGACLKSVNQSHAPGMATAVRVPAYDRDASALERKSSSLRIESSRSGGGKQESTYFQDSNTDVSPARSREPSSPHTPVPATLLSALESLDSPGSTSNFSPPPTGGFKLEWARNETSGVAVASNGCTVSTNDDVLDAIAHESSGICPHATSSRPFTSGRHRWDVQVLNHGGESNIFIGVARFGEPIVGQLGATETGWSFFSESQRTHARYHGGMGGVCQPYGASFSTGDVVGVWLDLDMGTLEFSVNDAKYGVAFDNIRGPVVAAVSFNPTVSGQLCLQNHQTW